MNFELDEILTIIDKVKTTGLDSFEYKDNDTKLKIKGTTAVESGTPIIYRKEEAADANQDTFIEAPMVGTFYVAPSEDADPFISVGDTVTKGQTIGIIEAMKLMNEIQADSDGVVEEILVTNETTVEYGQPLVRIRK
jgi:acetyl-CoA carboxylase biotin carboxyl carrier protein